MFWLKAIRIKINKTSEVHWPQSMTSLSKTTKPAYCIISCGIDRLVTYLGPRCTGRYRNDVLLAEVSTPWEHRRPTSVYHERNYSNSDRNNWNVYFQNVGNCGVVWRFCVYLENKVSFWNIIKPCATNILSVGDVCRRAFYFILT